MISNLLFVTENLTGDQLFNLVQRAEFDFGRTSKLTGTTSLPCPNPIINLSSTLKDIFNWFLGRGHRTNVLIYFYSNVNQGYENGIRTRIFDKMAAPYATLCIHEERSKTPKSSTRPLPNDNFINFHLFVKKIVKFRRR